MPSQPRPLMDRFWEKVDATGPCWEWTAALVLGYGRIGAGGHYGRSLWAHRVAWEHLVGPIPEGLQIDHLCRNRKCVNPDHLEVVTPAENLRRGYGPAAQNRRATRCASGRHRLAGDNLYIAPKTGKRGCLTCRREQATRANAKKKRTAA